MNKKTKRTILDYIYILLGSAITAISIVLFTNPAQIAPGGVSGIGTILYHTLGIDVGFTILVLSIPLFLVGVKLFGKAYGLKSLIGTFALSAFTSLFSIIFGNEGILDYSAPLSIWLSCLYGGVIMGAGIGIVMKSGSNTGGTDIVALIIARYFHIPAGTSLFIVDAVIIVASAFIFGIESALYAIVVVYITSIVINKIILSMGTGLAKTVFIISDKLEELRDFIIKDLDRSGTIISAKGLYSKDDKPMLMTVIPNQYIAMLTREIHQKDPKAFLILLDTHQVLGEGFTPIENVIANADNDVTQA